jgi:cobaltochelatase CobS
VATNGEMSDLQALLNEVVDLRNKPAQTIVAHAKVEASGDIPEGAPRRVNAQVVFGLKDKLLDMEITVYDWDGINPLVPAKDANYIFNVSNLADALWAIETKNNAWLTGHTGTGKTTFIGAVCAYTGRMMMRANMDSAIERPDFVGAMSVTVDGDGNQITKFVDGFLPKAMQLPVVMLLDEYDAIRADISYVMQPVLEGGSLRLMEDGGRMVHPHPDFHIMATANTVGTGDSSGLYASAVKVQSRASINRFPVFIKVDYLGVADEMALVKKFAPTLSKEAAGLISFFLETYRTGFADGTIATPISPRNTITIGKYVADFEGRLGMNQAVKRALEMNVMKTIDEGDCIAVTGIMDRITA